MRGFVLAIFAGVVAGASLPTLLTCGLALLAAIGSGQPDLTLLWFAALPIVVTIPLVLLGAIVIGLPATLVLSRLRRESAAAYMVIAAVGGSTIPPALFLFMGAPPEYWSCLLGAFSGTATGATWWAHARKPAVRQQGQ